MRIGFRWVTLLACGLLMTMGCAIAVDRAALVPTTYQLRSHHGGSLSIFVSGGEESGLWNGTRISNEDFDSAVRQAVARSGLFTSVVDKSGAHFRLDAVLRGLFQPGPGLGMDAQIGVFWALKSVSLEGVVWQDLIVTTGSASVGDAFGAGTRMRIAVERAANKNIQRAIEEMSLLNLASPP